MPNLWHTRSSIGSVCHYISASEEANVSDGWWDCLLGPTMMIPVQMTIEMDVWGNGDSMLVPSPFKCWGSVRLERWWMRCSGRNTVWIRKPRRVSDRALYGPRELALCLLHLVTKLLVAVDGSVWQSLGQPCQTRHNREHGPLSPPFRCKSPTVQRHRGNQNRSDLWSKPTTTEVRLQLWSVRSGYRFFSGPATGLLNTTNCWVHHDSTKKFTTYEENVK